MYELVYEVEGRPQRYRITGPEVFLGRSSENEVVLNDFSVSRRHAVIRRENERWVIVDQNSTNGVKVNGRFVASSPIAPIDRNSFKKCGTYILPFTPMLATARSIEMGVTTTVSCPIAE